MYELLEQKEDKVSFVLEGKRLKGAFTLRRMKGKEKEWLLMKKKGRNPIPAILDRGPRP